MRKHGGLPFKDYRQSRCDAILRQRGYAARNARTSPKRKGNADTAALEYFYA